MFTINSSLEEPVKDGLERLGAHIRQARKEAFRESRGAFAKRLGCSPMTVDRIENGEPGVAAVYLIAALQAMQVLPDVVDAASPKLLIATLIPVEFPVNFLPSDR